MQDSLELPDQPEVVNIQNLLSPGSIYPNSRENTPPHSLAYSNSTCGKDKMKQLVFRSPLAFESQIKNKQQSPVKPGVIKSNNNENHPQNNQYLISESPIKNSQEYLIQQKKAQDHVIFKGEYKRINPKAKNNHSKSPPKVSQEQQKTELKKQQKKNLIKKQKLVKEHIKGGQIVREDEIDLNERKTIDKGQILKLKRRIKELQQGLHMQIVISEQLRTKLSATNNLLQSKLRQNGMEYLIMAKNSSRDLKNIDIFVEMNMLHKQLTEKNIIIDRLQAQTKQFQLEISKLKSKKQNSPVMRSPNISLNEQIQNCREEKESLMSYIDEQKQTLKRKIDYIMELQGEINRLGDKNDHHITVQRPKMIKELTLYKETNQQLRQALEERQMEFNLIQFSLKQEGIQLKDYIKKLEEQNKMTSQIIKSENEVKFQRKDVEVQVEDEQRQILLKQAKFLKNQRDYYLNEYRKRVAESSKLYALQLKMAAMQESKAQRQI